MDRQTVILGTVLAVIVGLTGFYASFLKVGDQPKIPEDRFKPVTANSEENIVTASFYNQSIDLMYEDAPKAKMYLDYDQDGSFDYQMDVISDGEIHEVSRTVTLNDQSFALYFRYYDSSNRTEEGNFTLYKVRRP